jgi:hypothetical protein
MGRSDDVGEQMRTLVQLHDGNDIGKPVLESRMEGLVIYNIGIDFSPTFG